MRTWLFRGGTLFAVSVCVITTCALGSPAQKLPRVTPTEVYDPSLDSIRTVDQIVAAVDRTRPASSIDRVYRLEQLLRGRFYHGYSRYTPEDNWVAWLAARLIEPDLDAKVDPAEILEHPWAACSQQAMVVQAVLRRWHLEYGSVIFPGHFASAVRLDGQWYVVDPWGPLERDRSRLIALAEWRSASGRAKILAPAERSAWEPLLSRQAPRLAHVNQNAAPTMAWFHPLTKALSKWLWITALLWLIVALARGVRAMWERRMREQGATV